MSRRRKRWNAICGQMAKVVDERPTRKRISREQRIIECVTRAIGTRNKSLVTADDVASDIILELLNVGGFLWEMEKIEEFCRARTRAMGLRCLGRRERPECEFVTADDGAGSFSIIDLAGVTVANQELHIHAKEAAALLHNIPTAQRTALEILCDGGNPIDVAEEMGVTPWEAVTLIKEGRLYVGRVDPAN